ncbi:hypothetical protein GCM10007978_07370 [Shewanella hanedai]|uniref:Uncharacterized protein n=1 Tax=Shewanella hanedai TaxID=25 RepID=A0A553JT93_SHEHA|nr:hypothetical protein [Shewanella hanedai]TRY15621.1 hypothetical protein FN961_03865 [Shewanella hanedai]GGI71973.1 hypothetical protein GCM10007978_07370 [Shewanella hanedai]
MDEQESTLIFPLPIHTSDGGKRYFTIPDSEKNPNLLLFAQFIHTVKCCDWLNLILREFAPHLSDFDFEELPVEEVIESLSGIDDILLKIEKLSKSVLEQTLSFAEKLPIVKEEENIEVIKKFASANSLHEAFEGHEGLDLVTNMFAALESKQADILQASLACHMAGLTKPAQTLLEEFVSNEFLHGNELYHWLTLDLASGVSKKYSARKAAKSGNDSKHRINRQVRAKAVKLYLDGTFHNPRHATKKLLPKVAEISAKLGSSLEWENNGFERLYGWLRASNKPKKV